MNPHKVDQKNHIEYRIEKKKVRDNDGDDLPSILFPCKAKIKRHMMELKYDTFK